MFFLLAIPTMTFFLNRGPVSNLQRNGENRGDGERENHRRVAPFVLEGQKWGAGSSSLTRLFVQMDFKNFRNLVIE
jgi:hypothetical protein